MFEHYSFCIYLLLSFFNFDSFCSKISSFYLKDQIFDPSSLLFEEVGFLVFEVPHVFHAVHFLFVLLKFGSLLLPQVIFLFNIVSFFVSIIDNIFGSLSCLNLFWCNKFRATTYPTTTPRIIPSKMSRRLNKFT